jgi:hypothetical protein
MGCVHKHVALLPATGAGVWPACWSLLLCCLLCTHQVIAEEFAVSSADELVQAINTFGLSGQVILPSPDLKGQTNYSVSLPVQLVIDAAGYCGDLLEEHIAISDGAIPEQRKSIFFPRSFDPKNQHQQRTYVP